VEKVPRTGLESPVAVHPFGSGRLLSVAAENMLPKMEATLKASRVDNYEIYLQTPVVTQLYLRQGKVELINEVKHLGYGIRILDKGFGMTSSNQTRSSQIEECVKNAMVMARQSKPEKFTFPHQRRVTQVDIVDRRIKDNPEDVVRGFAEQLVNIADAEKVELPFAKVKAYHTHTSIMNSEGLNREKEETMLFTEISFKTSVRRRLAEYWATRYSRRPEDIPTADLERWAKLARENLKAEMPKTEKLEVILPPHVVCDLLVPVVGTHSTGQALKTDISKFEEGELVASKNLTVSDDGLYPYGIQSSPFDDEGNPQSRVRVVDNGVFKNYLYDQYYGLQYGKNSTGNGIRQTPVFFYIDEKFKLSPRNQTSNLSVKPGKKTLEDMISEVSRGLLVYKFSWLNPHEASGSFASEIRNAALIENGEIVHPIKGGLVSGNVFTMIKNITGISNEAEIASGETAFCCISPYLRFKDVQVAGD
jgi:predicted Zn-dependent protease